MAYEIRHGETGFDILEGGAVQSTGYKTRAAARRAIRESEKYLALLAYARSEMRKLCDKLEDDGLPRDTVATLLGQEMNWRKRV